MRALRSLIAVLMASAVAGAVLAQTPAPPATGQRPGGPGGGRRAAVAVMTLTSGAWTDGGAIPAKYSQAGAQLSPPLAWSQVPDGVQSFVLIVRDLDAAAGDGTDDVLHWLVWNIPGAARSLPEGLPGEPQLADGIRQISISGPYYRGPGAPASGPAHHYVFELYALDTLLEVPAVGQPPAATRAAVRAAMAGRVRARGTLVGLFKRAG